MKQVDQAHQSIIDFYKSVPEDMLRMPAVPEGWTIAANMKHVANSYILFASWIGMPSWLLKIFGKPKKPEIRVEQVTPTNRPNISDYGVYKGQPEIKVGLKDKLLSKITKSHLKFRHAVETRTEAELSERKSPTGGYTLRVFVLFSLKHNLFHTNVVKQRLEKDSFV